MQKDQPGKTVSAHASIKEQPGGEILKKEILKSVSELPPMPQTVFKVREIIANPDSSFKELAKILETDQAMAAQVLKIANSPYYGLSGKVSSIQHAAIVLGHKTLGELMTMAGTSGLLGNKLEGYGLEAGDLWRHSMAVAFGAKIIAANKDSSLANDAFTAGLLHDAGKLILDPYVFERKKAFEAFMADGQQSFLSAERQILGFDHPEIASEACKNWQVPPALSTAIRYHHQPSESQGDKLAYIVHAADALAMMAGMGLGMDGLQYRMDHEALDFLNLNEKDVTGIMSEVVESVMEISE